MDSKLGGDGGDDELVDGGEEGRLGHGRADHEEQRERREEHAALSTRGLEREISDRHGC